MSRRHQHDDGWIIWLTIALLIIIALQRIDAEKAKKEASKSPADQQQVFEEKMIEGVIQRLIPATDGVTIVIFDSGHQHELLLGDHEVHVGEWNQLRINHKGYVEEVWLGENAIQDVARN